MAQDKPRSGGERILDRLCKRIRQHVVLSDQEAIAVTLWVAHTHCFEQFRVSPRLCITSPERGCGKTTLLLVLNEVVRDGLMAAHATPAAVYHEINAQAPTLLFDEADTSFKTEDLIAILNSGHQRGATRVLRAGSGAGAKRFTTWSPAAYAVLQQVPDTLASRSIFVSLRRKGPDQSCQSFDDAAVPQLLKCKRKLEKWCYKNSKLLRRSNPEMPDWLQNREADNWLPLTAIADIAGGEWPASARQAAKALIKKEQPAIGTQLLEDVRHILSAEGDRIYSANLATKLGTLEGRPWNNFEGRGPINPSSVAKILAPYGVAPKNIRKGERVQKGYRLNQFQDAFARYLKPQSP